MEYVTLNNGVTQRKSDLTGSVSNVSSKDFNSGLISSPEQLINGKVSGVQIMSNSGSPTAGSTIRIRGGASLNAPRTIRLSSSTVYPSKQEVSVAIPETFLV